MSIILPPNNLAILRLIFRINIQNIIKNNSCHFKWQVLNQVKDQKLYFPNSRTNFSMHSLKFSQNFLFLFFYGDLRILKFVYFSCASLCGLRSLHNRQLIWSKSIKWKRRRRILNEVEVSQPWDWLILQKVFFKISSESFNSTFTIVSSIHQRSTTVKWSKYCYLTVLVYFLFKSHLLFVWK